MRGFRRYGLFGVVSAAVVASALLLGGPSAAMGPIQVVVSPGGPLTPGSSVTVDITDGVPS